MRSGANKTNMNAGRGPRSRAGGFTLMELMIAMAIGLVVMVGLVSAFVSATRAQKSAQQDSEQIENGRVAVDMLTQEIKMAGYYNTYYLLPTATGAPVVPASLPDPCSTGTPPASPAPATAPDLMLNLSLHVQLYSASSATTKPSLLAAGGGTSCGGLLAASNLAAGSDVLVVRRASTIPLTEATVSQLLANQVYLQTAAFSGELQYGAAGVSTLVNKRANGSAANDLALGALVIRDATGTLVAGDIFRYITRIYFVAPCSTGTGAGGVCTAADDSIPTMKRLDLSTTGTHAAAGTPGFVLSPMVEGIQSINFDSGIDNAPTAVSSSTGSIGDGQADVFKRDGFGSQTLSMADRGNTVSMNIFVLARNTVAEPYFKDGKAYAMSDNGQTGAGFTMGPYNVSGEEAKAPFRRHVYSARATIENISQRRENP